jgi:hypothetical protein
MKAALKYQELIWAMCIQLEATMPTNAMNDGVKLMANRFQHPFLAAQREYMKS